MPDKGITATITSVEMPFSNCQVVLARPLHGTPRAGDFRLQYTALPEPQSGQLLVRHIYLSLDPYQRPAMAGRHMDEADASKAGAVPPGETIGQVLVSRDPSFAPGDYVRHHGGWQSFSVVDGANACRVDPLPAPLSTHLGVLGMPGLTAWASVVHVAGISAGQTLLVSAATGPVGAMTGQLARQAGATVIGIAGSDEKCRYATEELGYLACINYRSGDYPAALRAAAPDGVDAYHDNVGGQMLMDALGVLRNHGTVVLCGLISQYNAPSRDGIFNLGLAIKKRAIMKGLVVHDYEERRQNFLDMATPLVASGAIRYREDRVCGLENAGAHFEKLMTGRNFGKAIVVIGPERMSA